MKNSISPHPDPQQFAQAISKSNSKILRELFKSKINGSFLIKIKSEVLNKLGAKALFEYYPIHFDNARIMTGTDELPEYDICRIIVGVHRHHSVFLSDEEIRCNQKSIKYQEQITKEVIEKIQLRQFGSAFFRRKQLFLGDEFLYFPVPYELFAMCMKSVYLINKNKYPLFVFYGDLIGHALSSLTLL